MFWDKLFCSVFYVSRECDIFLFLAFQKVQIIDFENKANIRVKSIFKFKFYYETCLKHLNAAFMLQQQLNSFLKLLFKVYKDF